MRNDATSVGSIAKSGYPDKIPLDGRLHIPYLDVPHRGEVQRILAEFSNLSTMCLPSNGVGVGAAHSLSEAKYAAASEPCTRTDGYK